MGGFKEEATIPFWLLRSREQRLRHIPPEKKISRTIANYKKVPGTLGTAKQCLKKIFEYLLISS